MARPVVIVGGGPVGLGLAIELGRRGVGCTVLERRPTPSPIPKGQNLTQRTMEHFRAWGCEDALRAARAIPPSFGIGGLTVYGTLLGRWHHDWLQRELVRPYYAADNERLPQYETERVLRDRVASLAAVETRWGWQVQSIEDRGDGIAVQAVGPDGESATLDADWVVGCDGSRSVVREQAGIAQTLSDHDRTMVLLVFRSTRLHALLQGHPGKSFFNVLHPDLEGYWRFFGRVDLGTTWFFHAPVPAGTTAANTDFAALLHQAAGADFDVELLHVGFWDLRFAIADTYRQGRVLLAGDAAHSHPPYGGYGINTGFEDARNLGWKLAARAQGWGGPALLDSYDAERRAVFASTARDFIERSIVVDRDFLARFDPARDEAAFERAWAERSAGARDEVGGFEPHYEGSPIVAGPAGTPGAVGLHAFRARPGHHLAPLALADRTPVWSRLGDGFTLLALGANPAPFVAAATALGVPLRVVDGGAGGDTARYEAWLVLVRPDHFVAACNAPGEAVDAATADAVLRRAAGLFAPS